MSSTQQHYETHLAPVYAWMAGGVDAAITRGNKELEDTGFLDGRARYAVDLGAGFGMHAIPLAKAGCRVLAIDSSSTLLRELETLSDGLAVDAVADDLVNFPAHLAGEPDSLLCMGDTLTHLATFDTVTQLIETAARHLADGGRFLLSFRDYSQALTGSDRFIPVQNDASRILTCFLEYHDDTLDVHDILHEYIDGAWTLRTSAYQKLRLKPQWVVSELEKHGFAVHRDTGLSGMVRLCAVK